MKLPDLPPEPILADFCAFGGLMLDSWDIDPAYPVLRRLLEPMPLESRLWAAYLYLTFYNLTSARRAFLLQPKPGPLPAECNLYPCATERRALRGGKVNAFVQQTLAITGKASFAGYWHERLPDDRRLAGMAMDARLTAIKGNGRWAAYKWGDLLRYCVGLHVQADGIGAADASGPRDGLAVLCGVPREQMRAAAMVERCEDLAENLRRTLVDRLARPVASDQVETLLCDFKSLAHGDYYVGHDIDLMHSQLQAARQQADDPIAELAADDVLAARDALPSAYRGELGGWEGVDKARTKLYATTGKIVGR